MFYLARKKIIFIIVEGPSDDTALGAIFNRIYDTNTVHVHITHGDITTRIDIRPDNVIRQVGNIVRKYAEEFNLLPKDFQKIIHIIDTDGAYIPDDFIVEDINSSKTIYFEDCIITTDRNNIINRNLQKRQNLNRLSICNTIWRIQYRIFYMSCNLDHALYGFLNLSDEEKESYAYNFALCYRNNILEFINFITNSDFSVSLPYKDSWNFIKTDCESLRRHTNLGICFTEPSDKDK